MSAGDPAGGRVWPAVLRNGRLLGRPRGSAGKGAKPGGGVLFTRLGNLCRGCSMPPPQNGTLRLIKPYYVNLKRVPTAEPGTQRRCPLLKGFVTRRDGVRIGRDQIGPLAGLEPILAALCEPAIGLTSRNPAIEKI